MTRKGARATTLDESIGRVRLRLTAWYVGTFFAILCLLGVGLFATITTRFDRELDASLRDAARELARVATARDREATRAGLPSGVLFDSLSDLVIPDRRMYLLDTLGRSHAGGDVAPWIATLARGGWLHGAQNGVFRENDDRILRGHAERVDLPSGRKLVAVAVADEIELEDRYAELIAVFGAAALAAVVLVAVGGWLLAGQTTAPIERAVSHMRRFMADAAHELRTPLTVLRSRAEVALQRPRDEAEYARALRGIEQDSARLGRIVEDLLMLARADTGERPIEHQRVFFDDVTLDAAEAARVMADRKTVRLEIGEFEEAAVLGDATLLRQLVMICLDNAIKFTAASGVVQVSVTVRGGLARLTVTDSGVGIPREQLPHVFERFYRGDPSRAREGREGDTSVSDGAGLGLSIARWIADEHHGTITIESSSDAGTQVRVELPVATSDVVSSS